METEKWELASNPPKEDIEVLCYRAEWDDYRICRYIDGSFVLSGGGTKYGSSEISEWAPLKKGVLLILK